MPTLAKIGFIAAAALQAVASQAQTRGVGWSWM